MIYPQNFEQKTGFDKIRHLITEKCLSPLGEERVAEMGFSADFEVVSKRLEQTDEFIRILHGDTEFPASYFFDVRYSLKRIRPEGTWLDERELFDLKRSLQTINDIVRFFKPMDDEEIKYPALTELAGDIFVFPQLIGKIDSILDKFGKVKDSASSTLSQIRREMTITMSGISRSLQSILRAAQSDGVVDKDVTPTMRDGRLMIPVAPAFKRKIKGIVHDESASGKTVFIEPEVVVEANNRIRELEGEERREIIKILTEFTNVIRPLAPDILQSYEFLADIDFIRAKALFAEQVKAIKPIVEDKRQMDWARAVHPLLFLSLQKQGKQVVPLDIELTEGKRILIISGPNAGGKSVCLKTVGLLQYMLQCGLLIPLHERSRTGIFEHIFIDIGDEDNGQTSAWYVFSALGFYTVCPGTDQYVLGTPLFKSVKLHLDNGKQVLIQADKADRENRYIKGMKVNGKTYTRNFLTHEQLLGGAKIQYQMSDTPNKQRGTQDSDRPYSFSLE